MPEEVEQKHDDEKGEFDEILLTQKKRVKLAEY